MFNSIVMEISVEKLLNLLPSLVASREEGHHSEHSTGGAHLFGDLSSSLQASGSTSASGSRCGGELAPGSHRLPGTRPEDYLSTDRKYSPAKTKFRVCHAIRILLVLVLLIASHYSYINLACP